MTIFTNHLSKLERENTAAFQTIQTPDARKKIVDMVEYLSASPLSLYQIQIIRKDLIGMAAEGERNNLSLPEILGTDPKEFCDEIIQNSDHRAPWEHFMRYLQSILTAYVILYLLKFILLNSAPDTFGFDYCDLAWLLICIIGGIILPEHLHRKAAVAAARTGKYLEWLLRLLALSSYIWLAKSPLSAQFIFQGNGWLILAMILICWGSVVLLMNRHWEKCAMSFTH